MQLKQKHSRTWHIYRLGVQRTLKEHNCMLHGRMVTCVSMRYDGAQDGGKNRVCVVGTSRGGGSGGVGEGSIFFCLFSYHCSFCFRSCACFPSFLAPFPSRSCPRSCPFPYFLAFLPILFIIRLISMLLFLPLWFLPSICTKSLLAHGGALSSLLPCGLRICCCCCVC